MPPQRLTLALALALLSLPASAQDSTRIETPDFRRTVGGQLVVTNSGFGVGVHFRVGVASNWVLGFESRIGAVKDAREVAFFDRSGARDVPSKANYLLEIPLELSVEKRLFSSSIEDNFRPFVQASAGPTFGWLYPYYEDGNGNGVLDEGETTFDALSGLSRGSLRVGGGVLGAVGAHFGRSGRVSQGVRLALKATYFTAGIPLLEPSIQQPRQLFVTPVLQFYLGRFW